MLVSLQEDSINQALTNCAFLIPALTLLSASIKAMEDSLDRIKNGKPTDDVIVPFQECKVSNLAFEEFII